MQGKKRARKRISQKNPVGKGNGKKKKRAQQKQADEERVGRRLPLENLTREAA